MWKRSKVTRTVKQLSGCAQSPLSSAFSFIIPEWGSGERYPTRTSLMAPSLRFAVISNTLVLLPIVFMSWKIMFIICAWWNLRIEFFRWRASTLGCMWQKQYGFLRLANFVTGGDCATIQNTAQLAKLAYGSFEVNDPLGWDILDTLKLLACLVEQLGCSINFTGTDLTQGELSNWLCKAVHCSIFHWSWAGC